MTNQDGQKNNNMTIKQDLMNSSIVRILMILVLVGGLIFLSYKVGNYYACDGYGTLVNGKCVSLVNLGYCENIKGNNQFVDVWLKNESPGYSYKIQ